MNAFYIISALTLSLLTILCFYYPYKKGNKTYAKIISGFLAIVILWTLIGQLDFLVIFIWPFIFAFQIIFLSYWISNYYNRKKLGKIVSGILTLAIIILALSPWITDWTFNKNDARKLLAIQKLYLKEEFKIIENESGGFTDYAQTFKLQISEPDKNRIVDSIRNTNNFFELLDYQNLPMADPNTYEHVNYETENYINWEYYTNEPIYDGTYHFHFQLSKENNEFFYFGINE